MPRQLYKRKAADEDSGAETLPAPQKKAPRTSGNTVKFADTVKAVSFGENDKPKSIRKTKSAAFLAAPGSPDTAGSPTPESSMQLEEAESAKQLEEEEFDNEEADKMSKLAADAMQMMEDAPKERLKQDLAAAQKELASVKKDLGNVRYYEKALLQSRDLTDANKRAETTQEELREALLANGRLENKLRTLDGRLKSADEQAEKLQREVAVLRGEKAEMEKLLEQKSAKETAEVGDGFAK